MEPAETPVKSVSAAVYVIPTDNPESDGTLAWDSTTLIVVTAFAAGTTGLGVPMVHHPRARSSPSTSRPSSSEATRSTCPVPRCG